MTRDQLGACISLEAAGWTQVNLPMEPDGPIPGLLLFTTPDQRHLIMVTGEGKTVDLLAVYRAADDVVRNWNDYPDRQTKMPSFVGDFDRLVKLAQSLMPKIVR